MVPAGGEGGSVSLWVIRGAGVCSIATAYVLADSPEEAVAKLTREPFSVFFVVGSVSRFTVVP